VTKGVAAGVPEMTETLSKVAVARLLVDALDTANPMYTFAAMEIVCVVPTCVQYTPSVDTYPVNVFPLRASFPQYGYAEETKVVAWVELLAPVVAR